MPICFHLRGSRTSFPHGRRVSLGTGVLLLWLALMPIHGQTVTGTIQVGTNPQGISVNPVTNRIYIPNLNSNNVNVINATTGAITTVPAGTSPTAVAVNPLAGKIYVVNFGSNNVTVIDGLSNTTATVAAGSSPVAVASSPSTASIKAGETATFTLTITPTGGFNSPVSVSCSGLPALATCTLTPASVTPKGSPVTATLALKTTGPNAALQMPDLPGEKRHRCLQFGCSMAHCGQPRWSLADATEEAGVSGVVNG